MCSPSGKTYEAARPPRNGRCSKSRTRQPASASATLAASPASPPPITITLFKNILFREAAEARLCDEQHLFRFRETHPFAENGEIEGLNAGQQGAVCMHQQTEGATTLRIDQAEKRGAFLVTLPGTVCFK